MQMLSKSNVYALYFECDFSLRMSQREISNVDKYILYYYNFQF